MAKYTLPEDINVEQSLKFTDGDYNVPGSGSNEMQVFLPERGFDLLYQNPNRNSGSTDITRDLDNRFKLGTYNINDRGYWEDVITNHDSLNPYFSGEPTDLKPQTLPTTNVFTPEGIVVDIKGDWTSTLLKLSLIHI